MKRPSWYDCLENAREASLELAASLLDAHASLPPSATSAGENSGAARSLGEPAPSAARGGVHHHRRGGDFLFDWLRLHVNYASQVAMLGSSYAGVVSRGLSQLYARRAGPGAPAPQAPVECEVEFQSYAGGVDTARLRVRNGLHHGSELVIGPVANGRITLPFEEIGAPGVGRDGELTICTEGSRPYRPVALAAGDVLTLFLSLDFRNLDAGRRYRAELPAWLGERAKPIHLSAEVFP